MMTSASSSAPPPAAAAIAEDTDAPSNNVKETTTSTTLTSSSGNTVSPRLASLFERFHGQIRRIDALENKINDRATQSRRRITNLLENSQRHSHRHSHLRLFVTHSLLQKQEQYHQNQLSDPLLTVLPPPAPKQEWRLLIEGKLLVGHLDHESAALFDKKTGYEPPNDDLDRSKGEKEEDEVLPIDFTHFFDKMTVTLEPLFQPKPHPMSKKKKPPSSAAKKSSRRGSAKSPTSGDFLMIPEAEEVIDPSVLVRGNATTLVWTRDMASDDAHAWQIRYKLPSPPGHHLMFHSIVARIQLYSRRPQGADTDVYQASPELAAALFPNHGPEQEQGQQPQGGNRKRKAEEISTGTSNEPSQSTLPLPPMENEIHIPQSLTMKEMVVAFFRYCRDRNLSDENNPGTIVCDETLQPLFGDLEAFPFYQLQQLLVSRSLVTKITDEPISLVYILKPETATTVTTLQVQQPQQAPQQPGTGQAAPTAAVTTTTVTPSSGDSEHHSLLQLDIDVVVPALFPFRTRELLRRIKRRELEYTSSRTKARYLLMARRAKSEDVVKSMIDAAVAGHGLDEDLQPVLSALSKSAPPNTEARLALHYDAQTSYLLGRAREYSHAARSAWALADACRHGGGGSSSSSSSSSSSKSDEETKK